MDKQGHNVAVADIVPKLEAFSEKLGECSRKSGEIESSREPIKKNICLEKHVYTLIYKFIMLI